LNIRVLFFSKEDKPEYLPDDIEPKIKVKEFFDINERFTIWFAVFCILSELNE
jgi:hypothetical protein